MAQQGAEDVSALIARKRAEVLSRIASLNLPAVPARPAVPPQAGSVQSAIAEARARIEARLKSQGALGTAPASVQPEVLHPMLRGDYKEAGSGRKRQRVAALPRISSVKANQKKEPAQLRIEHEVPEAFADPEQNPYFDPALGGRRTAGPSARRHNKQFQFVRPGRYVEQAEKQRAEAKLEQLKAEIEERAAKARLEEEVLDVNAVRPAEPPAVEWWDAPFLGGGGDSYDVERAVLAGPDSLVTLYVQHPVPVEPPGPIRDTGSAPTQLMLTQRERKKIRRQRRLEQQREQREKVMLGLLPPEQPRLKMSNFMRIMANQSVPDPTRLEAEVRRQVQARLAKHEADNEARRLTPDQRREKRLAKTAADEQRGLVAAAFRVGRLAHPQHCYKVSVNAQQMHLTGTAIATPQMGLVVVEGSAKNVKAYKKLMLRRIDWTAQPGGGAGAAAEGEEQEEASAAADYAGNECHLIWQGDIEARRFTQFRLRTCPTELQGKRRLAAAGCEALWQLAKQFNPDDSRAPGLDPLA
ncbi:U4/U5/U6 small nuclear ribonucleoprotein prp3 [Coemansia javaensis]|uniref:U4/U5/U6 small nuclear ribonucleoprotein prp3 n=1 Tax=Coemansia javaensis TaxID=2761396 RepID=A0A9W8LKP0_9FUNG|nr:U4/U5/U6 small nuclear ribonucleoprotein prp3 [Coemansia javaensis]